MKLQINFSTGLTILHSNKCFMT